jgi:hypothetical protein
MQHLLEYEMFNEGIYNNLLGTVYIDKFATEDQYHVWHTWYSPYDGSELGNKFDDFLKKHGITSKKIRKGMMIMNSANVDKLKHALNKKSE